MSVTREKKNNLTKAVTTVSVNCNTVSKIIATLRYLRVGQHFYHETYIMHGTDLTFTDQHEDLRLLSAFCKVLMPFFHVKQKKLYLQLDEKCVLH